jgi:hypothetical protein
MGRFTIRLHYDLWLKDNDKKVVGKLFRYLCAVLMTITTTMAF